MSSSHTQVLEDLDLLVEPHSAGRNAEKLQPHLNGFNVCMEWNCAINRVQTSFFPSQYNASLLSKTAHMSI